MLKALVPAAIVSILAATSASATPAASPLTQLKAVMPADTVQVQDRDQNRERRGQREGNREGQGVRQGRDHSYTAGRRYDRAPSHYRRHGRRPNDWASRGCILVGRAWFCA